MAKLNPYLHFKGNCQEAMNFYHDCLGGKLTVLTIGQSQMAAQMPPETHNNVIHSVLENDGITLMASDMTEPETSVQGNTVALCLVCSSKEEIQTLFSKLSAGGSVGHPLKEEFFGTFGDLKDKYGFDWMFQYNSTPQP